LRRTLATLSLPAVAAFLTGCSGTPVDERALAAASVGRFGPVAAGLAQDLPRDPEHNDYLLNRLRVLSMTVADGNPASADLLSQQVFDFLRTQGVNQSRELSSVLISDKTRIWKGEPFEQALAYYTIACQKAMLGDWENARAAAQSSLFLLRDFRESGEFRGGARGQPPAAVSEDTRTVAVESNFALGHIINALANRALARSDEMRESLDNAAGIDPSLRPLCEQIATGDFNTVLLVEVGAGPVKTATGGDGAIVEWVPRSRGHGPLAVRVDSRPASSATPALDVNALAADYRWNNLEGVRVFKSAAGDIAIITGIAIATSDSGPRHRRGDGRQDDNDRAAKLAVGAGLALLGALLKAGAQADTRCMELFPQAVYVVPLLLPSDASTVTLRTDHEAIVLPGLAPDADSPLTLRVVRVPWKEEQGAGESADWRTSGSLVYACDGASTRVPGDTLPYIFGGTCVRPPSAAALRRYQEAGNLRGLTLTDLENIYREEGITWSVEDQRGLPARHVLDGGTSLVAPLPGTSGFLRLFCQPHPPYAPRGGALKDALEQMQTRTDAGPSASP
jgi:hypothetical protein